MPVQYPKHGLLVWVAVAVSGAFGATIDWVNTWVQLLRSVIVMV